MILPFLALKPTFASFCNTKHVHGRVDRHSVGPTWWSFRACGLLNNMLALQAEILLLCGGQLSSAQRTVTCESGLLIKMALYNGAMPRSHKRRMHPNPASMPSIHALYENKKGRAPTDGAAAAGLRSQIDVAQRLCPHSELW